MRNSTTVSQPLWVSLSTSNLSTTSACCSSHFPLYLFLPFPFPTSPRTFSPLFPSERVFIRNSCCCWTNPSLFVFFQKWSVQPKDKSVLERDKWKRREVRGNDWAALSLSLSFSPKDDVYSKDRQRDEVVYRLSSSFLWKMLALPWLSWLCLYVCWFALSYCVGVKQKGRQKGRQKS